MNLTIPQNKLIAFPDLANSTYSKELTIGKSLGTQNVYRFMGVDPVDGIYIFSDKDGKPTSNPNPQTDRFVLVNTLPKFYGGLQNSITYKGIQLDFLFQFVKQLGIDYSLVNSGISPGEFTRSSGSNQPVDFISRWKNQGDISNIQRYSTDQNLRPTNANTSDASYSDASYLRLKNLSISWQIL